MIFRHLTSSLPKHGRISKGVLGRSPSRSFNGKGSRKTKHFIVTLDPKKFAEKEQQRLHLGDKQTFKPTTVLHDQPILSPRLIYDTYTLSGTRILLAYPPEANVFLYYFAPPDRPPISGELRMRVTSSDDPASFQSGYDLLKPSGQPWIRPVPVISKYYSSLYEQLREDKLVTDHLDEVLTTFPMAPPKYTSQFIFTLNDPFIFDFSVNERFINVATEQGVESLRLYKTFINHPKRISPYIGTALVRFERSTLPEHKGTRTVVLRFLKIIKPIECLIPQYDGYLEQPQEGKLFRRSKIDANVWNVDIDKKSVASRVLQLIWDK